MAIRTTWAAVNELAIQITNPELYANGTHSLDKNRQRAQLMIDTLRKVKSHKRTQMDSRKIVILQNAIASQAHHFFSAV